MGARRVRFDVEHSSKLLDCAVILSRKIEDCAAVGTNDQRERVQLAGALTFHERLIDKQLLLTDPTPRAATS
jgi:hypothetical protein